MRVRGLVVLTVLAVAAVVPALAGARDRRAVARAAPPSVTVTPSAGSRRTHFAVRFGTPGLAGVAGPTNRRFVVIARGPAAAGCDSNAVASASPAHAGQVLTVSLVPDGRGWCRGVYHGQIDEIVSPLCTAGRLCPEYVSVLRNLAAFRFRVR